MSIQCALAELSFQVSYASLRRLAIDGTIRATKVRGKILLDRDSFNDYLRQESYKIIAPMLRNGGKRKRR